MNKVLKNFEKNKNLRKVLSKFSTGVTVVTTSNKNGDPVGITVNSFSSVSLDPPLILWCLGKTQPSYIDFFNSNGFVVNILSKNQIDVCERFSKPCINKFKNFDHEKTKEGFPLIQNSLATIECKQWNVYPGGDHDIFVGRIIRHTFSKKHPLLFWNGNLV